LIKAIRQEISMHIQVNTDHTIEGHEALADRIRGVIESALSRVTDHVMRVEVHLTDETGPKNAKNNKRCMMEARLKGHQPIAVTDEAATVDLAINGAADKLARLIEHTLGKLHEEVAHGTSPLPHESTFQS
jgi:ribosome-associated translation inhibitor RaiA